MLILDSRGGMGWRYRRSYKILPGLRMNVGSRGVTSFSFGGRGVTVNMSKRGTKSTYSLPGTGLSYQTRTTGYHAPKPVLVAPSAPAVACTPAQQARRRSFRAYAAVGVAALFGYLALRPNAPVPQSVGKTVQSVATSAAPTPVSLSPVITPAPAAQVSGQQASSPSVEHVVGGKAVTTTGANVRSTPSRSGQIVKVLEPGAIVQIVATEGDWNRVLDQSGEPLGWVHGSILR